MPVLETVLQPYKNVRILQADALRLDIGGLCAEAFGGPLFGVRQPALWHHDPHPDRPFPPRGGGKHRVLLQKEAVERVLAAPGRQGVRPLGHPAAAAVRGGGAAARAAPLLLAGAPCGFGRALPAEKAGDGGGRSGGL